MSNTEDRTNPDYRVEIEDRPFDEAETNFRTLDPERVEGRNDDRTVEQEQVINDSIDPTDSVNVAKTKAPIYEQNEAYIDPIRDI